jgi:hypothetical protein
VLWNVDSHHPDSTFHPDANSDADPDSTYLPDANLDPDPSFQIKAQTLEKVLKYIPYVLARQLQIDVNPVPDPAYHFDADPGYQNDADPWESGCGSGSTTLPVRTGTGTVDSCLDKAFQDVLRS